MAYKPQQIFSFCTILYSTELLLLLILSVKCSFYLPHYSNASTSITNTTRLVPTVSHIYFLLFVSPCLSYIRSLSNSVNLPYILRFSLYLTLPPILSHSTSQPTCSFACSAMTSENEHDSKLWEQRHQELTQWQAKYGNCNVPKAEGKLGRWVVRQRELHKKGKLESERQRKLNNLGFVWNTNEAAWEHKYALLLDYYRRKGTCCVPISDSTLGMWVAKMRANRRRNKLSKHRIDKLNAIKFVWNTAEADWMDKYNRLLEYRNRKYFIYLCVGLVPFRLSSCTNILRQIKAILVCHLTKVNWDGG